MRIQNNLAAMNAHRVLGSNNTNTAKSLEKLSSGFKINRAGDDAAGLAISEKMRAQIKGLETAQANANDGISLVQTAEGALTEVHSMLNRMTELATKSANATIQDDVDRDAIQKEVKALNEEIDRISKGTNFNGIKLLDGSLSGSSASRTGTVLNGGEIASFEKAKATGNAIGGETLSNLDATAKDTFVLDGQKVEVDWNKKEFADVAAMIKKDWSTANMSANDGKLISEKFQDAFNAAAKEQGVTGSIKVTYDSTAKKFSIESQSKDSKSEVGFSGTDKLVSTTSLSAANSIGFSMFGAVSGIAVSNIASAAKTYNGDTLAATDEFQLNINGQKITITTGAAFTKGTTTMSAVATALETNIQAAITKYNTAIGNTTPGTYDPKTGLTSLTTTDFKVEAGKDGNLVVTYSGDVEDVEFSFEDVGDKKIGASLGLTGGSSSVGGGKGLQLQVGDSSDDYQKVAVSIGNMGTTGLGIENINLGTQAGATEAIAKIKSAINTVSDNRAGLGAVQNRLEHTLNNLGVTHENITAAESRIRDVDMAKEMMSFTKNNILTQAAQAMLAQANQQPQGVLQLLR